MYLLRTQWRKSTVGYDYVDYQYAVAMSDSFFNSLNNKLSGVNGAFDFVSPEPDVIFPRSVQRFQVPTLRSRPYTWDAMVNWPSLGSCDSVVGRCIGKLLDGSATTTELHPICMLCYESSWCLKSTVDRGTFHWNAKTAMLQSQHHWLHVSLRGRTITCW